MPPTPDTAILSRFGTVLVVDDSQVQREHALALCLRLGAVAVEGAADGAAALSRVTQRLPPPGLLIVDLEMPGMDGVQLLDALARDKVRVPIIVASQRGAALIESVLQMGRSSGLQVLAGLEKPLRSAELETALQAQLHPAPAGRNPASQDAATDADMLRHALRCGDIKVAYQPKVDMRSGQVSGVEALARWRHPRNGHLAPDRFIALAEREGLIHALTASVADQAMARLAGWKRSGLRMTLAINLSPSLLQEPGLLEELLACLDRHGLVPADVILEITESSLVQTQALGMLARLRLQGFGLSLDDYGTGFSSLQQLTRIPFTELKIDRIFVHHAHRSRNLRTLLESALSMAQRLGLSTVAEGIETAEDWQLLREFGCDFGQGYLLARPMGGGALTSWLLEHQENLKNNEPTPAPAAHP